MIAQAAAAKIERHQLVLFFVLAYIISWGSFYLTESPGFFAFGPFLAAVAIVAAVGGGPGLRQYVLQTCRWRSAAPWYLVALAVPVAIAYSATLLNRAFGATTSIPTGAASWLGLIQAFPLALVDAPLWEEVAWRGYALPHLSALRSRTANTLLLALLLSGWHLPLALAAGEHAAQYVICTFASALVTNWVYYNSGEKALIAVIYHAAQNAVTGFFLATIYSGAELQRWWWVYSGVYAVAGLLAISLIHTQKPGDDALTTSTGAGAQRVGTHR
jgi:uncharacterized protein